MVNELVDYLRRVHALVAAARHVSEQLTVDATARALLDDMEREIVQIIDAAGPGIIQRGVAAREGLKRDLCEVDYTLHLDPTDPRCTGHELQRVKNPTHVRR